MCKSLLQRLILCITLVCALDNFCLAENFLVQCPTIISQVEVDELPRFWSATFNSTTYACNFLYVDGRVGVKLTGDDFPTYTSFLWQELSESIKVLMPLEAGDDYYIDQARALFEQPQSMSVQELAQFIKNHTVLFYTGAGISLAADVQDMYGLITLLSMNIKGPGCDYAAYVGEHEPELLKNFADFCSRAFTAVPTKAHYALTDIALCKKNQIMTENFDFLHQRSGVMPYCINATSLRKNILLQDLQSIDAVICIGLSHDDRGFLGWYKRHNAQGTIIACDIGTPDYLGNEDFLVKGDAQETIPAVRDCLLQSAS